MKETHIDDLFVIDEIEFTLFDDKNGIAFNPRNQVACQLSIAEYGILQQCDRMLNIDEHAHQIFTNKAHSNLKKNEIKTILLDMKAKGMVLCPSFLLARIGKPPGKDKPPQLKNMIAKRAGGFLL